jgi:DUF2075 family protein
VPKSIYWASDKRGLDQVGCVYAAQGFEFDHVGVVFGTDLRYATRSQVSGSATARCRTTRL